MKEREIKMKVSRTVAGYIERLVNEKYADKFRKISEKEEKRIEEIIPIYEQASKELRKYLYEQARVFLNCDLYKDLKVEPFDISVKEYFYSCRLEHYDEELVRLKKEFNTLYKEKENKIQDIIITLELGGTKADLDRMLAEI